jgi:predicted ATPase
MYASRMHALAHLGRFDEARRDHELGRADCVQTGQLLAQVELAYARGVTELLDADAAADAAEHWLNVALAGARSNGMRLIELRVATSLAGVWQRRGEHEKAHRLLAPIYAGFTEGFDCTDLKEARALLDALRAENEADAGQR